MNDIKDYNEDLKSIKKIMEETSRFLSLSGLSGIFAGFIALAGGALAYLVILKSHTFAYSEFFMNLSNNETSSMKIQLIIVALLVLILALAGSLYFSYRKSLRTGQKIWTPVSKRMLINLLVPLATGGIYILILYSKAQWLFIIPSMLIFYGLALVSAGKFTYNEVFYLGLIEIATGLICNVLPEYGIFFWCFGFGVLHLTYGLLMYRKYER